MIWSFRRILIVECSNPFEFSLFVLILVGSREFGRSGRLELRGGNGFSFLEKVFREDILVFIFNHRVRRDHDDVNAYCC